MWRDETRWNEMKWDEIKWDDSGLLVARTVALLTRNPELCFQGKFGICRSGICAAVRWKPQCWLQPSELRGLFVACCSSQVHGVGRILCLTLLLRRLQEGKGRGLRAAARLISAKFSGCLPLALCCASSAPLAAWSYSSPWCIQILLGWFSLWCWQ